MQGRAQYNLSPNIFLQKTFKKRYDAKHAFCLFSLSPSRSTYVTNENPEPFQNQSCPVSQAASLCRGSPSEACVLGIRQTKPAATDKTLLSISHETKSRAWNTNPRGLAVFCSQFFCLSVMQQCAWVLNHLLLWGRTPSLKLHAGLAASSG